MVRVLSQLCVCLDRCKSDAPDRKDAAASYAEADRIDISGIPVIDLARMGDGAVALEEIGRAIVAAAEGAGFFYIRNYGIPERLIADVLRVPAAFFAEPADRKQRVAVNAGHRGFIQMGQAKMASSARPDLKESFIWGLDEPGPDGIHPTAGRTSCPRCGPC